MKSIYAFERTEIRVLQNVSEDNEDFLNRLADMIGKLREECDKERQRANAAEEHSRNMEM